jgi:phage-related protein
MPNGYITFNGTSSTAAGVKAVESYPALDRPRRKFTKMEIPGKTGDIVIFEDAWADYEQEYEIYAGDGTTGSAPGKFIDVMSWLHSADGYARLEDTYDTSTYRLAYFVGPTDVENVLNRYGRAKIKFVCQGKRFLKSGETAVTVSTSGTVVTNPTAFPSNPIIKVTGSGSGTLTVGGTLVTLNTIDTGMIIDCERMIVTDSAGTANLNSYMQLGDFPKITAGTSQVKFTGGVTKLEITPNYFVI